jgi:hypothetical protein
MVKVLNDMWSSVTGNMNTRAKDPVIGSFMVAWIICNWDRLALLFLGKDNVEGRISAISKQMAVFDNPKLLYLDLDLVILPLAFTLLYLFLLPIVSLLVSQLQKNVVVSQHSHAVEVEIERARKQWELNKETLRSNPNKGFLEKDVELDIQKAKERVERRNKIREYIDQKVKAANALSKKNEADATLAEQEALHKKQEVEERERKKEKEKQRFDEQSQIHKATMASLRFPFAYLLMQKLSVSLQQDEIFMSLEGLSECIAATFGYSNIQQLLDDKNFTNENFEKVQYILADDSLLKRLEEICLLEEKHGAIISMDMVFDQIQEIFNDFRCQFLSEDGLVDSISNYVFEDSYSVLNSDELSGPIAESDTIFEEIELEVKEYNFDEDFSVEFTGSASGHHRKESDVPGRTMDIWLKATCKPVIGKFGLGEIEDYEIGGEIRDYE